jgi:enolase-phosphatase E1
MMRFHGRAIVLDIEGTLCSHSYFNDVLAPRARRQLAGFLRGHWFDGSVANIRNQIARDAGAPSFDKWCRADPRSAESFLRLYDEVTRQIQSKTPSAAVLELLELSWRDGYRESQLLTHMYPGVHTALDSWAKANREIRTFSSISVAGQCALLAKTEQGNLLGYFRDHHDASNPGPKRAPGSFCTIADEARMTPSDLLYLSDDTAELDAARIAGFKTGFVIRLGNPPPPPNSRHPIVQDLRAVLVG